MPGASAIPYNRKLLLRPEKIQEISISSDWEKRTRITPFEQTAHGAARPGEVGRGHGEEPNTRILNFGVFGSFWCFVVPVSKNRLMSKYGIYRKIPNIEIFQASERQMI